MSSREARVGPLDLLALVAEAGLIVGLALAGWWLPDAWGLSLLLAVILPAAAVAVWGRWCAPRAAHRLSTPYRWAVKVTLFSGAFVLLMAAGLGPGLFGLGIWLAFLASLPADRGDRMRQLTSPST